MCIGDCLTLLLHNWSSHFPSLSFYSTLHLPLSLRSRLTSYSEWIWHSHYLEKTNPKSPLFLGEKKKIISIFPLPFHSEFNSHTSPPPPYYFHPPSISTSSKTTSFCSDTFTSSPSTLVFKMQLLVRKLPFVYPSRLCLFSLLQPLSLSPSFQIIFFCCLIGTLRICHHHFCFATIIQSSGFYM